MNTRSIGKMEIEMRIRGDQRSYEKMKKEKKTEQENFAGVDVKVNIAVAAPFGFQRGSLIVISC